MNIRTISVLAFAWIITLPITAANYQDAPLRDTALDELAPLVNGRNVLMLEDIEAEVHKCGKGCGACEVAHPECSEGYSPTCSCEDTGGRCGWWIWERAVYKCTCTCTPTPDPSPPPPERICVGSPDPIICLTTNTEAEGETSGRIHGEV